MPPTVSKYSTGRPSSGTTSNQPANRVWKSFKLLKCCFTSTGTVGLLGTGAQDVHLDFHTVLELCKSLRNLKTSMYNRKWLLVLCLLHFQLHFLTQFYCHTIRTEHAHVYMRTDASTRMLQIHVCRRKKKKQKKKAQKHVISRLTDLLHCHSFRQPANRSPSSFVQTAS